MNQERLNNHCTINKISTLGCIDFYEINKQGKTYCVALPNKTHAAAFSLEPYCHFEDLDELFTKLINDFEKIEDFQYDQNQINFVKSVVTELQGDRNSEKQK